MEDSKNQGLVQIALRISPDLRERIKRAADINRRSVNAELTAVLEDKYPGEPGHEIISAALNNMLDMMIARGQDDWHLYVVHVANWHGLPVERFRRDLDDGRLTMTYTAPSGRRTSASVELEKAQD